MGRAVLWTYPPETAKRVTGVVCRKIVAFCCDEIRAEATFTPTNRFVGTKTYWEELTMMALPP
jgi:hypothetical protein